MSIFDKKFTALQLSFIAGIIFFFGMGFGLVIANYLKPLERLGTGVAFLTSCLVALIPFWIEVTTRKASKQDH